MPRTSPLRKPRAANPAATRRTAAASWRYVIVRPVGPSIRAGLSPRCSASPSTIPCSETSGIVASGYGLRMIAMVLLPRRLCAKGSADRSASRQRVRMLVNVGTTYELYTPALLVDLNVMERNIERMARTFRAAGVGWRPHTKGLKVPQIAARLLEAGAFGVTCAKVGEAEVMANAGIRDILIANQVVGEQKIARLLSLLPRADVIVAVDSPENVDALDRAARERDVRLRVVVEVNTGMDRAGVEPGEASIELSRYVEQKPGLHYAGLMGWEGHTVKIADPAEKRMAVRKAVGLLTA